MTDNLTGTGFAGVANVTEVISVAAQAAVVAEVAKVKALIPDPTAGASAPHPDFDQITPQLATKLRAEFVLLAAAIDAAPTA